MFGGVYFNREDIPSCSDNNPYALLGLDKYPLNWIKSRPSAIAVGRQLLALVLVQAKLYGPGDRAVVFAYEKRFDVQPDEVLSYLL